MEEDYKYEDEEPRNKPSIKIWVWIFLIGCCFFAIYDNQDWIIETWEENKPSFDFEFESMSASPDSNVTVNEFQSSMLGMMQIMIPLTIIMVVLGMIGSLFGRGRFLLSPFIILFVGVSILQEVAAQC